MSVTNSEPGGIILGWWQQNIALRDSAAARMLAARVRRASDIEILCEPAVHDLARKLGVGPAGATRLLRIVRVLAEFRGNSTETLARRLGGVEPILSNSRFQRLLRSDQEELATSLIRAARMLGPAEGRVCNIARLGSDLWFWNDTTRMHWSFDYFHTPAPETVRPVPQSLETESSA